MKSISFKGASIDDNSHFIFVASYVAVSIILDKSQQEIKIQLSLGNNEDGGAEPHSE